MRIALAHERRELVVLAVRATSTSGCTWHTLLEALAVVFAASRLLASTASTRS